MIRPPERKDTGARDSAPASATRRERPGSGRREATLFDFLVILLLCLIFMFGVVRPFVAEPLYVPTESMSPTLVPGDRVLAAKFFYRLADPRREDLALLSSPEDGTEELIKRVVGLPGDTVEIRDGVLYVNDERKNESYVNYRLTDSTFFGPLRVPEGHVFVMGDNRSNSRDSREFGPVPEKDLLGKIVLRFWPLDRIEIL